MLLLGEWYTSKSFILILYSLKNCNFKYVICMTSKKSNSTSFFFSEKSTLKIVIRGPKNIDL